MGAGLLLSAGCTATPQASSTPHPSGTPGPTSAGTPTATGQTSPPGATASATPEPSATSSEPWPASTAWRAGPGEVQPEVKLQAVRVVEALGTWPAGREGLSAAASRVAALGQRGALASSAGPLLGRASRASVQVIDAQYGGILATSASVLVACRQWRAGEDGRAIAVGTTVDVRLVAHGSRWTVTELHPAAPGRPLPRPSALARRVLSAGRIGLPPAAAADVRSGRVHDSVLRALLTLSRDYRIDVSVIRSGHPVFVFGTSRRSDHPKGRAFDTWRINGHPVVDPRTSRALVVEYMHAAASAGSYNVGGPYLLSGPGNQFFTDATHHDHVHAGFQS